LRLLSSDTCRCPSAVSPWRGTCAPRRPEAPLTSPAAISLQLQFQPGDPIVKSQHPFEPGMYGRLMLTFDNLNTSEECNFCVPAASALKTHTHCHTLHWHASMPISRPPTADGLSEHVCPPQAPLRLSAAFSLRQVTSAVTALKTHTHCHTLCLHASMPISRLPTAENLCFTLRSSVSWWKSSKSGGGIPL